MLAKIPELTTKPFINVKINMCLCRTIVYQKIYSKWNSSKESHCCWNIGTSRKSGKKNNVRQAKRYCKEKLNELFLLKIINSLAASENINETKVLFRNTNYTPVIKHIYLKLKEIDFTRKLSWRELIKKRKNGTLKNSCEWYKEQI